MSRCRSGFLFVALALAGTGWAGCGTKQAGAAELVASAPAKTEAAKTAKMAIGVVTNNATAASGNVEADGVYDFVNHRGVLQIDLGQQGGPAGTKIDLLMFGSVFYERVPPKLASSLPGGKSIVRVDLAKAISADGNAGQLRNDDPTQALTYLRGISNSVGRLGSDTVRGAKTTHFRATVDIDKLIAGPASANAGPLTQLKGQLGKATFPVELWIDRGGRLRKEVTTYDFADGGDKTKGGRTQVTVELFDYGTPVNVTEPPPDQVTDLTNQVTARP